MISTTLPTLHANAQQVNSTHCDDDNYYFICTSENINRKVRVSFVMAQVTIANSSASLHYFVNHEPFPQMQKFLTLPGFLGLPKTIDKFKENKKFYWTYGRTPDPNAAKVTSLLINIHSPYSLTKNYLPYIIKRQCLSAFPNCQFKWSSLNIHEREKSRRVQKIRQPVEEEKIIESKRMKLDL